MLALSQWSTIEAYQTPWYIHVYCYVASVCDGLVAVTVYICALVNGHRYLLVLSIKGFLGGTKGAFAPLKSFAPLELGFNNELALT